jgi:enediyne biosynthesis protein E4
VTRRRGALFAAVAIAVALAVGAGALVVSRLGAATPTTALGAPHYVDETAAAGIDQVYDGDFRFATGGGVAAFDCDGDRRPELYLAGGAKPAALYRNESPTGGALRFARIDDPAISLTDVIGAYPLDVDDDGNADLAVLGAGETLLLRGLGECRFERANDAWSFDGGDDLTTAFSATWEASASRPTLAFGRYLALDAAGQPTSQCGRNVLVRPEASGGYAPPIDLAPGFCALSMLFSDWDRSGRCDLRVSNDREFYPPNEGQEQLWRIAPGEAPRLYTDSDGWVQLQIEGMGIASHDLTGDGFPEVYLTNQGPNRLQSLLAGPTAPTYRDVGLKAGVYAEVPYTGGDPLPSTGWHAQFEDVNDDGFVDLFVAKGNVDEEPDHAMKDPSNLLLGRPDGTFVEGGEAAGIVEFARGRGATLADLNLDGPNRDATGAWIEVKVGDATLRREVTVGGGHAGGELGWLGFGLGPATGAQVRVQWPNGETGPWLAATADTHAVIERGAGQVRPWQPPPD